MSLLAFSRPIKTHSTSTERQRIVRHAIGKPFIVRYEQDAVSTLHERSKSSRKVFDGLRVLAK